MPRWLDKLQGLVTVLDSGDNPFARLRTIKFGAGLSVDTETVETDSGPEEVIVVTSDGAGAGIDAGSYVGQPVVWNGSEYVPIADSGPSGVMRMTLIRDPIGFDGSAFGIIVENSVGMNLRATDNAATVDMKVGTGSLSGVNVTLPEVSIDLEGDTVARFFIDETGAQIGFFGVTPVLRPSITGATDSLKLASVIAAGEALGLWTDDT